ncbi:MarR family EPS-associated transcriptional regulator [bacterium]|nr:MAG: MarR family EPS-associated transcriptional regulator [bacterium]
MNGKNQVLESEDALRIIKEVESDPKITQRLLARKLEISLGKVNFFLNALIDKGIIEAKNFKNSKNKLGYMYLLTSDGIRIKLKLIHKFLAWKELEYRKLEDEISSLKKERLVGT